MKSRQEEKHIKNVHTILLKNKVIVVQIESLYRTNVAQGKKSLYRSAIHSWELLMEVSQLNVQAAPKELINKTETQLWWWISLFPPQFQLAY